MATQESICSGMIEFLPDSHKCPFMHVKVPRACDSTNEETWNEVTQRVWSGLKEDWKLTPPALLISVTGGAKQYARRPGLDEIVQEGLVNAAISTGAWIITGGTATGVMELVGEAVEDHRQAAGDTSNNDLVALGVASWGFLANREELEKAEKRKVPAKYSVEQARRKVKAAPLDGNHTHFLLVDDETTGKAGGEILFRSKLEKYISTQHVEEVTKCRRHTIATERPATDSIRRTPSTLSRKDKGLPRNILTVLIVVEGGVNTLKTVRTSLQQGTPVVVIAESGRAADFITEAAEYENVTFPDEVFQQKAMEMLNLQDERKAQTAVADVKICLQEPNRHLLTIFKRDTNDLVKDIQSAVLSALLKAENEGVKPQVLSLAIKWHRWDFAKKELLRAGNKTLWELDTLLLDSLLENQPSFVQYFLDLGVDVKLFLTAKVLEQLYNNTKNRQAMAKILRYSGSFCQKHEEDSFSLSYISRVFVHLMRDESFAFDSGAKKSTQSHIDGKDYVKETSNSAEVNGGRTDTVKSLLVLDKDLALVATERSSLPDHQSPTLLSADRVVSVEHCEPSATQSDNGEVIWVRQADGEGPRSAEKAVEKTQEEEEVEMEVTFQHPERELFLWAVLFNRRQLARLFWERGLDHLGGAVCASALLKRLSTIAEKHEMGELSEDLKQHSEDWERLAVDVLSLCHSRDSFLTHRLLVRELPLWGPAGDAATNQREDGAADCCCLAKAFKCCGSGSAPGGRPTLLNMAESYGMMDFAGHSACQTKLTAIWKGRMAFDTHEMLILLCTFLPVFIPFIYFNTFKEQNSVASESTQQSSKRRGCPYGVICTVKHFYNAPITKFLGNMGANLVYLALFSYFVLVQLSDNAPTILECITWAWLFAMFVEEIRQMLFRDQLSTKYRILNWVGDSWNQMDAAVYFVFFVSLISRFLLPVYGVDFKWARAFYSVTLVLLYLRFMQYFYAVKSMGPKVIMIQKMMADMLLFIAVLLVFVIGFGVAYHANMFPNSPPDWSIVVNVIYYPYFQIYGELFLENMRGEEVEQCTRNETEWLEEPGRRCPTDSRYILHLLLGVYLILTNILLVNLLIAMFSYTFQQVQEKSKKVWRFYRLSLVHEYFDRPALVPPFIIFNHIYRAVRHCCLGDSEKYGTKYNAFRRNYKEGTRRLTLFEKSVVKKYLTRSSKNPA